MAQKKIHSKIQETSMVEAPIKIMKNLKVLIIDITILLPKLSIYSFSNINNEMMFAVRLIEKYYLLNKE